MSRPERAAFPAPATATAQPPPPPTALPLRGSGLRTALVEREDFAAGTSSRSTKLVHGGVRYLEKAGAHRYSGQAQGARLQPILAP